jgi:hypothetical protein
MITNTRLTLYAVIAISFFSGCYGETAKKRKADFDAFPVEKKINETGLFKIEDLRPDAIELYNDSLLFQVNGNGEKGYHFFVYNLPGNTFLPPQLEMGRKQDQALNFHSHGFEGNKVWAYDTNKGQIIFSGLDSLRDTSSNHFIRNLPVPGWYYSVGLLNDTTLLGSGNYLTEDNYKLSIISLTNGKVLKQLAPYTSDSSAPYNKVKKMAYESFLFVKPSKDKCALAFRYTDRIDIVDLNTGKSKTVFGPEGFEPEMKVINGPDNKKMSARNSNTRYAFVRGKVTDHFIYLLYSGNKSNTSHLFYVKYIYVYDWNGEPVQRLELKDDVKDFAVTTNDSLLYTYNPETKYVSTAKLTN